MTPHSMSMEFQMWRKPFGKTGKQISTIAFGGMRFPTPQDIDASADLVLYGHSKGINYFDTAPFYLSLIHI